MKGPGFSLLFVFMDCASYYVCNIWVYKSCIEVINIGFFHFSNVVLVYTCKTEVVKFYDIAYTCGLSGYATLIALVGYYSPLLSLEKKYSINIFTLKFSSVNIFSLFKYSVV